MRRLVTLAALLAAGPAFAQPDPEPHNGRVTIKLDVSPAAEPVPAARFNVYPEYRDRKPGSRVLGLLRCFAEMNKFYGEDAAQRQKLLELPLADLPDDARQQAGVLSGSAYSNFRSQIAAIDDAARYDRVEWNEFFPIRRDGINFLIPEVQVMRQLAAVVRLRMRAEVKAGEWTRAVESAKTLFGIAQALEQHPTIIGNLVGIAIAQLALNGLEELSGRPGAPSLFWALADLPAPVVGIRHGLGGERVFLTAQFQGLLDSKRPLADADLARYLGSAGEIVKLAAPDKPAKADNPRTDPAQSPPQQAAGDPRAYFARVGADPAARQLLADAGYPAAGVAAMPPAQVGLVADLLRYDEVRDELFKWAALPQPQRAAGMSEAEQRLVRGRSVLSQALLPAIHKVTETETRLTLRAAQLRVVEGLRLHAQTAGRLPATLDEVKLPLPADPFTGKPFAYGVKDGVATIGSDHPFAAPQHNRWYEVRLRK